MRDFICVSVRVPKSGSLSLTGLLNAAFADRRIFYLPTTTDVDGRFSLVQRLRFQRSRMRNLFARHRTFSMAKAYAIIDAQAANGDLVDGGHIDFPAVRANLHHPLKMIVILRDPFERLRSEYNYSRQVYLRTDPIRRLRAAVLPKIAGTRDLDGYLDFVAAHPADYGNIASRYAGWDGREDLRAFVARDVFHAGILEESERFAQTLSEKVGKPLSFPHTNRTEERAAGDLTPAQRARIEQLYDRDCALYEWVRRNV